MLERLQKTIEEGGILVCATRKDFEKYKDSVYNNPKYLTHYYYKFTDVACVGICLRGGK